MRLVFHAPSSPPAPGPPPAEEVEGGTDKDRVASQVQAMLGAGLAEKMWRRRLPPGELPDAAEATSDPMRRSSPRGGARRARGGAMASARQVIPWHRAARSAILGDMGVRIWFFLRHRPGELRPLAQSKVDAFFFRDGRLPVDEEGLVRYAEVMALLEDRRAVEVVRVSYFQCRASADGTLDRRNYMELMAVAGEAAFGPSVLSKPSPGVVGAEHRFAQRRLDHLSRWKPTKAEVELVRDLVNRRAGCDLL